MLAQIFCNPIAQKTFYEKDIAFFRYLFLRCFSLVL